jgi:hypothetical protein
MKYMESREIYLTYLALGYIEIDNKCMDINIVPSVVRAKQDL